MSRLHATDPPGQAWAMSYLCLVSMQLIHRAKLGPWAIYVSSPCNWSIGPSLGHELFMSRLLLRPNRQIIIIMIIIIIIIIMIIIITICKAPTLRLKSLKKHSITHIMFIACPFVLFSLILLLIMVRRRRVMMIIMSSSCRAHFRSLARRCSMQLTHRAKLGPWAVYVSSPCNWPTWPSLGHKLFMSRLHATDPPGQAWAMSCLCLVSMQLTHLAKLGP